MQRPIIYPTPMIDLREMEIGISKMSITYCQPLDGNQNGEHDYEVQEITISTEESGALIGSKEIADGKQKHGFYFTLKTKRWAFEDADELAMLINDFIHKLTTTKMNPETDGKKTLEQP